MTLHSTATFSITDETGTANTGSYTSRSPRTAMSWLAELMTGHARQRPTADATAALTDGNPSIDTPAIEWVGTVAEIAAAIENHLAADGPAHPDR